jgi:hypothetical protein
VGGDSSLAIVTPGRGDIGGYDPFLAEIWFTSFDLAALQQEANAHSVSSRKRSTSATLALNMT